MAKLNVPVALIRRLCYPDTYRLPKLTYLVFPKPVLAIPVISRAQANALALSHLNHVNGTPGIRTGPVFQPSLVDAMRRQSQPIPISGSRVGNMPNEDYRFWVGRKDPEWDDCQCRFCEAHVRGVAGRKGHHANSTCRESLGIVYKIMRRTKCCVMCDAETNNQKWGIHLCDPECQNDWRLSIPGSLRFAVSKFKADLERSPGNA